MTATMTRNAARRVAVTSVPPWLSWRGSKTGKYIKFVESQLVIPKGHGARKPMKLHKYQRDLFEMWADPSTRASMAKVARGNAKTTTLGSFITAHLFIEEDANVPIVATTLEQARKTTYGVTVRLIELAPNLMERANIYTGMGTQRLAVPGMNSEIYPMADRADGLQGLDPTIAVLDEAAFASQDTWDALVLAAGKRVESLAVGIGTPSFTPENAMLGVERAWRSGKVLPGFTFREWAAPNGCDIADEKLWPLANPGLITKPPILAIDALRTSLAISPEQAFRCFRLAQWPTASAGGWLGDEGSERWDNLASPFTFVSSEPTWVAVDVALKHDTAAVVAIQRRPDGRWHAIARIWYPPEGATLDVSELMEYLRMLHRTYKLVAVPFDPRFFDLPARILEDEGLPMIEFPQSLERMTPAVGGTMEAINNGQITHDGDQSFTQQVLNAQPRFNDRGFTLSKPKSTSKIDAAVALCMAYRAACSEEPEPTFDERWLSVL